MTRISRRELLRFVAYGLPSWLVLCHTCERNEPAPVQVAAPRLIHLSIAFNGRLTGSLSLEPRVVPGGSNEALTV